MIKDTQIVMKYLLLKILNCHILGNHVAFI